MNDDRLYGAFADWRLGIYARQPRRTVRFFRTSLAHTVIWMTVMRGYHDGDTPTLGACEAIAPCSHLTARKLISEAIDKKFLILRPASDDSRKRLVLPTARTIREYREMVDGYADFFTAGTKRGRQS